jgi:hypothetical protein
VARDVSVEVRGDGAFLVVATKTQKHRFALTPSALRGIEADLAAARVGFDADALCTCGNRFREHGPLPPHPCAAGCTMSRDEMSRRAGDPTLTDDPRYGCKCIAFTPTPAAVAKRGG